MLNVASLQLAVTPADQPGSGYGLRAGIIPSEALLGGTI